MMSEIKFCPGKIYLHDLENDVIYENAGEITDLTEYVEEAPKTVKLACAEEVTLKVELRYSRIGMLCELVFGKNPYYWPVSQNWLHLHGYPCRRRKARRKMYSYVRVDAKAWQNYKTSEEM